ncbi:MAG: hypothetical protein SVY53_13290 [Chloroflexota bacterium]|nr:hypothetical protein [Chloroflexota bacterium]
MTKLCKWMVQVLMVKKPLLIAGLILTLSAIPLVGCEDDGNASDGNNMVDPNPESQQVVLVEMFTSTD